MEEEQNQLLKHIPSLASLCALNLALLLLKLKSKGIYSACVRMAQAQLL